VGGLKDDENVALYTQEMKKGDAGWGPEGRMTTYAGTGVGLVKEVMSAKDIVKSVQQEAMQVLQKAASRYWQ